MSIAVTLPGNTASAMSALIVAGPQPASRTSNPGCKSGKRKNPWLSRSGAAMKLDAIAVCPGVSVFFQSGGVHGLVFLKPASNLSREKKSHDLRRAVGSVGDLNQLRKIATCPRPTASDTATISWLRAENSLFPLPTPDSKKASLSSEKLFELAGTIQAGLLPSSGSV